MQRHSLTPRKHWIQSVEALGMSYHSHDTGPYWDESACYELSARDVEHLESAARALHQLCVQAAEVVVERQWWDRLAIPRNAIPAILRSWERDDFHLYGRFDFAYDGTTPPKMLEYNADTPTALLEAAVVQWFWLEETHPKADQFNSLHERLIEAWRRWEGKRVHFASVSDCPEDEMTLLYLRDTAEQAGVPTVSLPIGDLGWDDAQHRFVDLESATIERCFKLYPWEWMWQETFAPHLDEEKTQFIEPAWKMLLSSKGLLTVLWELFPGHPNLLPAYDTPGPLGSGYVRKPKWSREGSGVQWRESNTLVEENAMGFGDVGEVYQAIAPMPEFNGNRPVFGAWIVDHEPAGLGIREDRHRITGNLSRFIPHFFH